MNLPPLDLLKTSEHPGKQPPFFTYELLRSRNQFNIRNILKHERDITRAFSASLEAHHQTKEEQNQIFKTSKEIARPIQSVFVLRRKNKRRSPSPFPSRKNRQALPKKIPGKFKNNRANSYRTNRNATAENSHAYE
jgi:hypothetical protein